MNKRTTQSYSDGGRKSWITRKTPMPDKFWNQVSKSETGCWEWRGRLLMRTGGAKKRPPYGLFYISGKHYLAHRMAHELATGPIPSGVEVCHKCDNPTCCRPDHLFLGTRQENQLDSVNKGRRDHLVGGQASNATLTDEQAREARLAYAPTIVTSRMLATKYGVSKQAMDDILAGRHFKNVEPRVAPRMRHFTPPVDQQIHNIADTAFIVKGQ